jgi:hypothetical protein
MSAWNRFFGAIFEDDPPQVPFNPLLAVGRAGGVKKTSAGGRVLGTLFCKLANLEAAEPNDLVRPIFDTSLADLKSIVDGLIDVSVVATRLADGTLTFRGLSPL